MNGLFVPFLDGRSIQLWDDDARCDAEVERFAPRDLEGFRAMCAVIRRLRDALRPANERDIWIGEAPTREQIEDRLGNDAEARSVLFDWSMAEFVEHYLRGRAAAGGIPWPGGDRNECQPFRQGNGVGALSSLRQGVWAACRGCGGMSKAAWGWSRSISATRRARPERSWRLASRSRRILPGEGVLLEGGERIAAPIVVSNADPRVTLRLVGGQADAAWKAQVESVPIEGCTVKLNVLLNELPNFKARPGADNPHHYGQINAPLTKAEWKQGFAAAKSGKLPEHLWCELYFQSVHDSTRRSRGQAHDERLCAVCAAHLRGKVTWDDHREAARKLGARIRSAASVQQHSRSG